ncbi:flavodoxin family protein [Salinibacterium sp. SYSU T00001]|uniref:flavodoxin family protein n=1 Tax=Homoserinimonas sedimenticola TaxID=2986805 RepID=UPI002236AAE9|nr:flavodoxin family protein [Salinibacterium sedimenticola]MCW4386004.1 flavodoxin family protein [Salinibacterium sedimenticola]
MSDQTNYEKPPADYTDLRAIYINCSLKPTPQQSHTQGLMDRSINIMRKQGVQLDVVRFADHDVATGVYPDMREHGAATDAWPEDLWPRVQAADILVVGTPIWLGEISSLGRQLIERLYAMGSMTNDKGQYIYYGKVGGAIVTGNEDGVKNVARHVLYSLQHIGYTIPPGAEAGWIGPVGPGPSYLDPEAEGPKTDFTNQHVTFMTWNLLHLARMFKDAGGLPSYGNDGNAWQKGERFGFEAYP